MFIVKKIITSLILPPGIFVLMVILCGLIFLFRRGSRKAGLFCVSIAVCIWATAVHPASDALLQRLEHGFPVPQNPRGDVIILLGGGAYGDAPDMTGLGFPAGDSAARIITAVRLQRALNIPVLVSGGSGFLSKKPEAPITRRLLIDLGVPEHMVITEDRSRDTFENARYSVEICKNYKLSRPIVVTSAYHMERAVLSFEKNKMRVTPYPAGFKTGKGSLPDWEDYLPSSDAQANFVLAAKEYLGLVWYQFYF